MSLNLCTQRLTLIFEPDVETIGGFGGGRCGVYYLWHTDCHLGALSLASVSRDCGEIGYEIDENWRGQGFASEAVSAVVAACPSDHGFKMLTAQARVENFASRRVLEKNGFNMVSAKLSWSHAIDSAISIVTYRRIAARGVLL